MKLCKKVLSVVLSVAMAASLLLPGTQLTAVAYTAGTNLNRAVADGGARVAWAGRDKNGNISENGGNFDENAFDGNYDSQWQAANEPANEEASLEKHDNTLEVEYDGVYTIKSIKYMWKVAHPRSAKLQASMNGTDWYTVMELNANNMGKDLDEDKLGRLYEESLPAPINARYLRLSLHGSVRLQGFFVWVYDAAPSVAEFEAYGEPAASLTNPANTQSVVSSYAKVLGKGLNETQNGHNGYTFTYGASGIEVNFTGTSLAVYVSRIGSESVVDMMVSVDTDMPMEATKLPISGTGWITVASGLENKQHTVKVQKMSRGFYGIMTAQSISISDVATDGTFLPADPVSDLVIEVYGDSITNGDATWLNANGTNSAWTAASYSTIVGRLLGAETRITGNTGNGLCGWVMAGGSDNLMLENALPPQNSWSVYDPNYNGAAYSHAGSNAADVVIINLGTNDRIEHGGVDLSSKTFADEYVRFIKQIKTDCPDAIVICTLGAMGGIAEWYSAIAGDGFTYYDYSYTRLTVENGVVVETQVTGYVDESKTSAFRTAVTNHTAASDSVADVQAKEAALGRGSVVVKPGSLVLHDGNTDYLHRDDNVLTQCNSWYGSTFVYWTQLAACNTIDGGVGYDGGHPSNVAHEIYAMQIAELIKTNLPRNVGLTGPTTNNFEITKMPGVTYSASSVWEIENWEESKKKAEFAFDGNAGTYWQAKYGEDLIANGNVWLRVDFGEPVSFNFARVSWNGINANGTAKLQSSNNGTDWTDISGATGFGAQSTHTDELTFTAVTARYVRLYLTGASSTYGGYAPEVTEFEVYNRTSSTSNLKFVVSRTAAQRSSDSTKNEIRLIAAVNAVEFVNDISHEYAAVGFEITVSDPDHADATNTRTFSNYKVYDSIGGYTATDLDVTAGKVFAFVITDVPEDCLLDVIAFALDPNDPTQKIYGYQEKHTIIRVTGGLMTVRN